MCSGSETTAQDCLVLIHMYKWDSRSNNSNKICGILWENLLHKLFICIIAMQNNRLFVTILLRKCGTQERNEFLVHVTLNRVHLLWRDLQERTEPVSRGESFSSRVTNLTARGIVLNCIGRRSISFAL